ncbi:hypothetical protein SEUCBS139899_008986 [Sporothrix eucalyptigena]|uniref:Cyclohexanone monooxygenase n=1 Tax=Sporothrix eucalyptigena TaxID=1812306 RepID=A0ABP0AKY1_9PEZI
MTISQDAKVDTAAGNGSAKTKAPEWIPINEQPLYKPRKLRVVCVGAGYSGLMLAYKYKYQMPMDSFLDLTIYEKNADVGGTWYENRYPGVACDVPAHIYTFSWEPNPDWSSFYAKGGEIWEYIRRTTTKYNLDERVQFNSKVVSSIWDEAAGQWKLEIEVTSTDGSKKTIQDSADVLVNGSGILNKWRWPAIEGLHDFKGTLLHSAKWDTSLDWAGKRVGIIGNGSSAIQILPQMQPTAARVVNYIRSPTWVSSPYSADLTPEGKNFQYTEEEKKKLREDPQAMLALRRKIEDNFNKFFYALLNGTPQQQAVSDLFLADMRKRLNNNPELCAKLIPEWAVGCRRLTPGDGYLEALQAPNAAIEFSPIARVTPKGIETADGRVEELDIIVCATGFDVSFAPYWDVIGRDGVRLADQWRDDPQAYFGICAPNMPNYFIFNGPNCPVGHGSLLAVMEWTAEYVLKWCHKIATEDLRAVAVNAQATAEYNAYTQEFMGRTAWASGCHSWYKNNKGADGKVTAMYAGSILHYKEILASFRTEDFDLAYRCPQNRFKFMGNGITLLEEAGGDLSFYVTK